MQNKPQKYQKLEALQAMAEGIVHDFNNILAGIIGYSDLALDEAEPGSDLHLTLSMVMADARRGADLVREILTLSQNRQTEKQTIQLRPLVKAVIKRLRPLLPDNIDVHQDIPADTLFVFGDLVQLYLLISGLYFRVGDVLGQTGGIVKVVLKKALIKKQDAKSKPGLPAGKYLRLTLNLQRKDCTENTNPENGFEAAYKRDSAGSNRWLSYRELQNIIADHRGQIRIEPVSGDEIDIHLYLPLKEVAAAIPCQQATVPGSGQGENILVVDDEPHSVDVACRMLENLGYSPTGFVDSSLALMEFTQNPDKYDLVITDYSMPKISGAVFIEKIRELRPQAKLILCSGVDSKALAKLARELNIDNTFSKPFVTATLAAVVAKALADHSA